jgi:hypothetical protein
MGEVYQCWWRICQEINVFSFPNFEYRILYILYIFVTKLLTLPHLYVYNLNIIMHILAPGLIQPQVMGENGHADI